MVDVNSDLRVTLTEANIHDILILSLSILHIGKKAAMDLLQRTAK